MVSQNSSLNDEVRNAQENLRLSAGQMSKLQGEFKTVCGENDDLKKKLTDYQVTFRKYNGDNEKKITSLVEQCVNLKASIEKKNNEIRALGGQVQTHQQNLRLSAAQFSKMGSELNDYKNRLLSFEG